MFSGTSILAYPIWLICVISLLLPFDGSSSEERKSRPSEMEGSSFKMTERSNYSNLLNMRIANANVIIDLINLSRLDADTSISADELFDTIRQSLNLSKKEDDEHINLISGIIVAGPAKVRLHPSVSSAVVETLKIDDVVQVIELQVDNVAGYLEMDNNWIRVITTQGTIGYLFDDFVSVPSMGKLILNIEPDRWPNLHAVEKDKFIEAAVSNAVEELDQAIIKEDASFSTSAFKCREELERCRPRYGIIDCDLIMIVCLFNTLVGG